MSCMAIIARKHTPESYTFISCIIYGEPEHCWPLLTTYYRSTKQVEALLANGALYSLGATIGEQHAYDSSLGVVCHYLHRDLQHPFLMSCPSVCPSEFQFRRWVRQYAHNPFVYLWVDEEQKWYWVGGPYPEITPWFDTWNEFSPRY